MITSNTLKYDSDQSYEYDPMIDFITKNNNKNVIYQVDDDVIDSIMETNNTFGNKYTLLPLTHPIHYHSYTTELFQNDNMKFQVCGHVFCFLLIVVMSSVFY